MRALIVVDAQNEFSAEGQRAVPGHAEALARIREHVERARAESRPIAWVRHYNRPDESPAFVPGSWGAELSPGLGAGTGFGPEQEFDKDVFGAFSGTGLEAWLVGQGVDSLLVVGFYAHMCVSTTTREALVRGFQVQLDPAATGAGSLRDPVLGSLGAAEVVRTAMLHLLHMGASLTVDQAATAELASA
jgi:nicotinamidase-related amidase